MARSASYTGWKSRGRSPKIPGAASAAIDVASWADEEGHFGSFLGSRSFVGDVTEEEIDKARDRNNGTPLREALASCRPCGAEA